MVLKVYCELKVNVSKRLRVTLLGEATVMSRQALKLGVCGLDT